MVSLQSSHPKFIITMKTKSKNTIRPSYHHCLYLPQLHSHLIPLLLPLLNHTMEDEINALTKTIKNIQIPPTADLPIHLLQASHNKWTKDKTMLITILHGNNLQPGRVIREIRSTWRVPNGLEIQLRDTNLFLCHFTIPQEKARVLSNQPSEILRHLVLMKDFSADMNEEEINFDTVPLNIGFKGLKLEHLSIPVVWNIAACAGEVLSVAPNNNIHQRQDGFKAKVLVKVHSTIIKAANAPTLNRGDVPIEFIYLNLPSYYCYRCEKIGYDRFDCKCDMERNARKPTEKGQSSRANHNEDGSQGMINEPMSQPNSISTHIPVIDISPSESQNPDTKGKKLMYPTANITHNPIRPTPTYPALNWTSHQPFNNETPNLQVPGNQWKSNSITEGMIIEIDDTTDLAKGKGGLRGKGRGRGRKIGNGDGRNNQKMGKFKEANEISAGISLKKRKTTSFTNYQCIPFIPERAAHIPAITLPQIWEFLRSPLVAEQLAAQGIINPVIAHNTQATTYKQNQSIGNQSTEDYNLQKPYLDELSVLGAQIHASQMQSMERKNQSIAFQLLHSAMSNHPDNEEGPMVTVDHMGTMEGRTSSINSMESIVSAQSEINLTLSCTPEQPLPQVAAQLVQTQQIMQNAEELQEQSSGESPTNGRNY